VCQLVTSVRQYQNHSFFALDDIFMALICGDNYSVSDTEGVKDLLKAPNKDTLNYKLDSHWTELGHSLAAQILFDDLNEKGFLKN
jgi:hypothetical protein